MIRAPRSLALIAGCALSLVPVWGAPEQAPPAEKPKADMSNPTTGQIIEAVMQARHEVFPAHFPGGVYPPNTLLIVSRLVKPELLVEIEAMAVKPAKAAAARRRPAKTSKRARTRRRR